MFVLVRGQVLGSGTASQVRAAKEKAAQSACQALGISA
jgi:dsRNA-specific ribonuclease